ncbi:hypothetical protein DSCO28_01730 [Desulfosarcina ovata subsp. sediminis]|uniref:Uncharacterized protein n=1 Tax=Desulfosarcina ovata subsp. sediminis TaxID=885957 RepID=A0A5K7ZI29_9BACT|nr:hypothetical protein [Desulfosarcina ovata]BBO79607.1 hypothetical protein DSCO28_01730 [Desulfosarcina ovata subsp. sediminis]
MKQIYKKYRPTIDDFKFIFGDKKLCIGFIAIFLLAFIVGKLL